MRLERFDTINLGSPRVRASISAIEQLLIAVNEETDRSSLPHLGLALRILARLMVRSHCGNGDPVANVAFRKRSSDLTVVPKPSPHHDDEEA